MVKENLSAASSLLVPVSQWGRRRVEQDRFVALRSHYLFESAFTRAGKQGAHEKGCVEGEVGRFRRAQLVLVPEVSSLRELYECSPPPAWPTLGARPAAAARRLTRRWRRRWTC